MEGCSNDCAVRRPIGNSDPDRQICAPGRREKSTENQLSVLPALFGYPALFSDYSILIPCFCVWNNVFCAAKLIVTSTIFRERATARAAAIRALMRSRIRRAIGLLGERIKTMV